MVAQMDTVQFGFPMVYAMEGDSPLTVSVMRLGSLKGRIRVEYFTEDASAKAGIEYEEIAGELVFEDGEDEKTVDVNIYDDDRWAPTMEFKLRLRNPSGCDLGKYLHICRVQRLDDDLFPSNTYREEIEQGEEAINSISAFKLFWEYFKLNAQIPGMAWRTYLTLFLDQLKNMYLLLTLVARTYLVNIVLVDGKDTEDELILPDRDLCAILIGLSLVAPMFLIHFWDYRRTTMDIQGRSKSFLQTTLLRKYLNYCESSRQIVSAAHMQVAITQEANDVAQAYGEVLSLVQNCGRVFLLTGFTLWQSPSTAPAMALLPGLMLTFIYCRSAKLSEVSQLAAPLRKSVVGFISETCDKFNLIAEYQQRSQMNEIFEAKTEATRISEIPENQVQLNNDYFPKWLGPVFSGGYIALCSGAVLDGSISMGVFLAMISVFGEVSGDFEGIFCLLMSINTKIDSLRTLTYYYNLPTDSPYFRELAARRKATTEESMMKLRSRPALDTETGVLRQDLMPITVDDISFAYIPGKNLFADIKPLKARQGDVVAVVGTHGSGKNTFLRLIADRLNPDNGYLFMPSHLRSLFVSGQPIMLNASVWKNLTYGDPDMQDTAMVKGILRELQMDSILQLLERDTTVPETVAVDVQPALPLTGDSRTLSLTGYSPLLLGQDGQEECEEEQGLKHVEAEAQEISSQQWLNTITYSERVKISLARAFIMNPEILILYRPFHHFDQSTAENLMQVIQQHHRNRGLCLPEELASMRRPRTVFFSPETLEQACEANVLWQIDHIQKKVFQIQPEGLNPSFQPASASELAEREKAALAERLRLRGTLRVGDSAKAEKAPKPLVPSIHVSGSSGASASNALPKAGTQQPPSKTLLAPPKPKLRPSKSSDSVGGMSSMSTSSQTTSPCRDD
eukprot:TRINITY_DN6018_c0_g1_i1.p1 TRINITY_DN6018_c0_g1~~TRINITY_DN6018_c0_g1_i1.p1  ORF type:complete len:906 (-),score=152.00 TRINITY_DN6018_c0_g1_i1:183-2900(-)